MLTITKKLVLTTVKKLMLTTTKKIMLTTVRIFFKPSQGSGGRCGEDGWVIVADLRWT